MKMVCSPSPALGARSGPKEVVIQVGQMVKPADGEASSCVGENLTRNVFLIVCVKIKMYLHIIHG